MSTLTDKPGISIIKAGSLKMNDLSLTLNVPGLISHISEQAVTNDKNVLSMGHFTMRPGEGFEYTYNTVECKVITKGKIVIRDKEGNKHTAEAGDVIVFSPDVTVYFDGESDGEAIYIGHRELDQDFALPK
ncbi:cupin domain-containing protein [Endozoicomonas lisbonensis]|uniref:Cupin superfamily protein n=1 Tax=Endozoicomonas lisbonensis TaxID=3120522 RepID=A0ABV2SGG3_9GAMM